MRRTVTSSKRIPPIWTAADIAGRARAALEQRALELREEQAVVGLDGLDELTLHEVLRGGLSAVGSVLSEVPFPGVAGSRAVFRDRERCDVVLLPDGYDSLRDPVADNRDEDAVAQTLFASVLGARGRLPRECSTREAYWLEVKVARQFHTGDAEARPNPGYVNQAISLPARDIRKLTRDAQIERAGLMLVLFTDTEATAVHDVGQACHRFLAQDLGIRTPVVEGFVIDDRIGHSWCAVVLFDLRCGEL